MPQSITSILSLTELFDNLTSTQLELIASVCEPATYQTGYTVFKENDNSDELYVIGRGSVQIIMNPSVVSANAVAPQAVVLTELGQGQVFGELALVDQGLRSATAKVNRDKTEILRIPRQRLMLLCDTYPELGYKIMRNMAADLALKVRKTDLTIRQYQLMLAGK